MSRRTVLHNITDDTEFVKVASTAFSSERFFESNLNIIDVMTIPGGVEELVAEAHDEDVLDHLLAQVVIYTENLLFLPIGFKGFGEIAGALEVLTKWLFDL